jgi:hypothetical protein
MECAQQQLQQLTTELQQLSTQPADSSSSSSTATAAAAAAAAGFDKSKPSPGAEIGQLAVAAVQLGALQPPVISDVSKGSGFSGGLLGPGPAESARLDFAAALVAAAGSVAAAGTGAALDAASASDIAFALTELKVQQPGLVLKLQEAAKKEKSNAGMTVAGSLAAVAAAAAGSMSGSSSSVLMRLVRGVVAAESQPGKARACGSVAKVGGTFLVLLHKPTACLQGSCIAGCVWSRQRADAAGAGSCGSRVAAR